MRVINVIVNRYGVIDSIESFGVYSEKNVNSIVAEAEDWFKAKIIQHFDNVPETDIELAIENGFYEDDEIGMAVCLSWSNVLIHNPLIKIECGNTITNIGELRAVIAECDEDDSTCLTPCDEDGDEIDHYPFYVDIIDGIQLTDGTECREVRLCMQNHEAWDIKEKPYDQILYPDTQS